MRKYTNKLFDQQFPDDSACLEFLKVARWPDGITCVRCQKLTKHYRIRSKKVYGCEFCGHEVSPMADTIFHKSPTPLRDWFYSMFLMASTRMGISAKQLERELGVTYKTAWRMFTQIRKLMAQESISLFGQVEADESYFRGKDKNRHESKKSGSRGRGATGKTIAVGLVQRGGKAIVKVTPSVKAKELLSIIQEHIPTAPGTTIFTDELPSYNHLGRMGFTHERVQHSAKQYVNGTAHTNNIEGIWSTIKNGINGVNRHVSPKHLQGYLDSYVFRYNHRKDDQPMFPLLLNQVPSRLRASE